MPDRTVEGEVYLDTIGASDLLNTSRARFYVNARPYLRIHRFDAKKTPWYKKSDVLALKNGKPARKASLAISGILDNWTDFVTSLGYNAETQDRMKPEITTLPEDAVREFHLPADKQFVKRSRITYVDGVPICTWETYYPLDLVGDFLSEIEQGIAHDIVRRIKGQHGVVVEVARDRYSARLSTPDEQNLFRLPTDESVLILQRVSYTKDKRVLVLYSDMVLLASWFTPEHEYPVVHWSA